MSEYAAAWVPWVDGDMDTPIGQAVEWVEARCAEAGQRGLLVVERKGHLEMFHDDVQEFAARHALTSPRGALGRPSSEAGPVLVYYPDYRLLDLAMDRARGAALCVLAYADQPLAGWAAATGAVNLATGEAVPPLDDGVVQLFRSLRLSGNNGWTDDYATRMARHFLAELQTAVPGLTADYVASYVLALDHGSTEGIERLRTLAEKTLPPA
jgi:hypothetical protein